MNEQSVVEAVSPEKDARNWAMICHLSVLSGFIIPGGNIIVPSIIWAMKKDEYAFVDEQGKEALNFQTTLTFACAISVILMFVLIAYGISPTLKFVLIGFALLAILFVYSLIMIAIASMQANDGVSYRFPCTVRVFK